jgi:ring-1,2-phenylacetyl-CoA epoxidase subunit PaaE
MARFHKLKVTDVRKETADCVSLAFTVPAPLSNEFKYLQGQYLTFKLVVNGEEIRRSYSLCSCPVNETELRVAVKRVKDGRGSSFLNSNVKAGDELEVMTPMGNFHSPMNAAHKKNYVLFAGGSGITPMLSIIKTVLQAEPNSTLQLFYGNLNEQSTIFKDQLDQLASANPARLSVIYIFDKPSGTVPDLQKGMMTTDKVKALAGQHIDLKKDNEFFICGPGPMMDNAKNVLESLGVEKTRIHIEYFTASLDASKKTEAIVSGDKVVSQVTIILDGQETVIELASSGKVILDAALDADLDVPFACKGAVCCTCRAKVLEGKVKMDQNFALTDSEVAEGFILTCQSHPLTPMVKVDYDV